MYGTLIPATNTLVTFINLNSESRGVVTERNINQSSRFAEGLWIYQNLKKNDEILKWKML